MPSGLTTRFSVSYDRTTKVISTVVSIGLLVAAVAVHNLPVAVLALAIFGLAFACSPRGYVISNGLATVKRSIGDVRIPLEGVREARVITKDDLRGCIRLWGNGGLFGYYGLFRTHALGVCSWYVTNRSQAIVVKTAAKTVVFSPDDKEGFLSAVRNAAPEGIVVAPEPFAGIQVGRSSKPVGVLIGIAVAIVAIGLAAWAMLYSPGPPAYTLIGDSLTIHDKFYPVTLQASAVDIGHIRVVNLATEADWRPVVRTNGFANSHYRSGWFRTANGRTIRLYQAGGSRMVLLPPKGNGVPVLYQAEDPEEFVQEITTRWTGLPSRDHVRRGTARVSTVYFPVRLNAALAYGRFWPISHGRTRYPGTGGGACPSGGDRRNDSAVRACFRSCLSCPPKIGGGRKCCE